MSKFTNCRMLCDQYERDTIQHFLCACVCVKTCCRSSENILYSLKIFSNWICSDNRLLGWTMVNHTCTVWLLELVILRFF
jgi:hypothetical protein